MARQAGDDVKVQLTETKSGRAWIALMHGGHQTGRISGTHHCKEQRDADGQTGKANNRSGNDSAANGARHNAEHLQCYTTTDHSCHYPGLAHCFCVRHRSPPRKASPLWCSLLLPLANL